MDDSEILSRIHDLVKDEHMVREARLTEPLGHDDVKPIRSIEEALDQCWDLLRQRRARMVAGQDPDGARVRPTRMVEAYLQ